MINLIRIVNLYKIGPCKILHNQTLEELALKFD